MDASLVFSTDLWERAKPVHKSSLCFGIQNQVRSSHLLGICHVCWLAVCQPTFVGPMPGLAEFAGALCHC